MSRETRSSCRPSTRILARHGAEEVEWDVVLTPALLKTGTAFLVNAILEDERVSLALDGLQRTAGPSKLGDFHYVPVLFSEGRSVHKQHRTLLDVYALLLSRLQGRAPGSGIIWHGKEAGPPGYVSTRTRERPSACWRNFARYRPRRQVLNDHCAVCEFRQRCHELAVQEDNISLLRGLDEKEVRGYARKGVLTVTQLAHTFRPRRKSKRPPNKSYHHYHALQAMAIRDSSVYVSARRNSLTSPGRSTWISKATRTRTTST